MFDTPWRSSQEFYKSIQNKDAVLVFLRYHGCPVCQMEMANFRHNIELFNEKGARVFVFLQSAIETLRPLLTKKDWPFDIICDPKGTIFMQYGVHPGCILNYVHPAGLAGAIKATAKGYFHKKFEGKETQLPAAFIINPEKIIAFVHYGKNISDVPSPSALSEKLG